MKKGTTKSNAVFKLLLVAIMLVVVGIAGEIKYGVSAVVPNVEDVNPFTKEKQNEVESEPASDGSSIGGGRLTPVLYPGVDSRVCYLTVGFDDEIPLIRADNSWRLNRTNCLAILEAIIQ